MDPSHLEGRILPKPPPPPPLESRIKYDYAQGLRDIILFEIEIGLSTELNVY